MNNNLTLRRFARLSAANAVFTPGSPIDSLELLSGRLEQVGDILSAFQTKGQHIALYGERGVGKTSIANVVADAVAARPNARRPFCARIGCSSSDDYQSIWETVFKKLKLEHDGEPIHPEYVRTQLSLLDGWTLIVLDEFDRLTSNFGATSLFADTIKLLSDDPVNATILIVGVADSIDELVEDHRSVGRALRQVQIPRMNRRELEGILEKGAAAAELEISSAQRARLAGLSEGLPHFTHALGLYATQRSIENDRSALVEEDIEAAKQLVVRKSQQTILTTYKKATRSARQVVLYDKVLLACALAPKDEIGMFAARDVSKPLSTIMGAPYDISAFAKHLQKFASEERGAILQKHGEHRRHFYRFDDPMMQPFVILDGLTKGMITEEQLAEIRGEEHDKEL